MKKIFLLLPVVFMILVACNNKKEDNNKTTTTEKKEEKTDHSIVGNWKVIEMNIPQMSEEEKQKAIKSASLELKKDNTYTSVDSRQNEYGTYTYDEKAGKLIFKTDKAGSQPIPFTISWSGNNMIMTMENASSVTLKRM